MISGEAKPIFIIGLLHHPTSVSYLVQIYIDGKRLLISTSLSQGMGIKSLKKFQIGRKKFNLSEIKHNSGTQFRNLQLYNIMERSINVYHLHIRKNKRLLDRVKRNALLTACLENKTDLFDTIKKQRRTKRAYVTTMDGQTENIPDHLASTYKNLYNSTEDEEKLTSIEKIVEMKIYDSCWDDINRITWNTLRDSAQKLKGRKSDPFLEISSDYLSNAPDSLYQMLSMVFKSYISHGHVSEFLLLSTLIPIIKNKMGDITSSDNYRSIAISSLILKIFDNVILSSFSENLELDELQFGYQTGVSTSMCTWLAVETIEYFNRNGSDVYTCLMDMSKAFDTVRHSLLFQKLLDHGLPPRHRQVPDGHL